MKDFRPARALGQNFLIVPQIACRQVELADIHPGDRVLEIGPGRGILTRFLLEAGASLTAVELDRSMAPWLDPLKNEFDNLDLVWGDALAWLDNLEEGNVPFDKIVANIPYSISTDLVFSLIRFPFERAVLMVQEEFARRMIYSGQGSKDYSRLTVSVYMACEGEYAFGVPASAFDPAPQVDSAVVVIRKRASPPFVVKNKLLFANIVKAAFSGRRKMLHNSIKPFLKGCSEEARSRLVGYFHLRPEYISPEDFGKIANTIAESREKQGKEEPGKDDQVPPIASKRDPEQVAGKQGKEREE